MARKIAVPLDRRGMHVQRQESGLRQLRPVRDRRRQTVAFDPHLIVLESNVVEQDVCPLEMSTPRPARERLEGVDRRGLSADVEDGLKDDVDAVLQNGADGGMVGHAWAINSRMVAASTGSDAGFQRKRSTPSLYAAGSASGMACPVRTITRAAMPRDRTSSMTSSPSAP